MPRPSRPPPMERGTATRTVSKARSPKSPMASKEAKQPSGIVKPPDGLPPSDETTPAPPEASADPSGVKPPPKPGWASPFPATGVSSPTDSPSADPGPSGGTEAGAEETRLVKQPMSKSAVTTPRSPSGRQQATTVVSARYGAGRQANTPTGIRVSKSLIAELEKQEVPISDRPTVFHPSSGRVVTLDPECAVASQPHGPTGGGSLEDRVELVSIIGRGGMGSVHAARDRQLLRTVAVKILNRSLLEEASIVRRFLSEAQVLAQLEHPNIVPFYTLEQTTDGVHAFSMRLVQGETFTQYLLECSDHAEHGEVLAGRYSLASRIEHLLKVCDAIDYSHSRGVIHRDIKPDNLMLGSHNEVYVMDWGIALVVGAAEGPAGIPGDAVPNTSRPASRPSRRETEVNQAVGTLSYMPPEQAAGRLEEPHPTTDVYALGMVLQEMVTLQPARSSGQAGELMMSARAGVREPIDHRFGAKIPRGLKAIIEHATAPRRQDRYPTVKSFADDLRRFVRYQTLSVLRDPWYVKVWRAAQRHPVTTLASILVFVLVASGLAVVSLLRTVEVEKIAAEQTKAISDLALQSARRSHELSSGLSHLSALIDEISSATVVMLNRAPLAEASKMMPKGKLVKVQNDASTELRPADGYQQPVNFSEATYILRPGTVQADVEPSIKRLVPVKRFLREAFIRSAPKRLASLDTEEQDAELAMGVAAFHWVYVALAEGLMISYPASKAYPDVYDHTERPWYRNAVQAKTTVWGVPYADALSDTILVPVHRAILGPQDAILGVAGADVTLDDFLHFLALPSLKGWQRSLIVDDEARVLMDSHIVGTETLPGLHAPMPAKFPKLDIPSVAAAIIAGKKGGYTEVGRSLVVYNQLEAQGWFYVVVVDAATFLASKKQ